MALAEQITAEFPSAQVTKSPYGETLVKVAPEDYKKFCRYVKEGLGFSYPSDLTGTDRTDCLEVVLHLFKMEPNGPRLTVKVQVDRQNPKVESVTDLWPGVDWHERETMDMFGIDFEGHPDLRRILLPENWQGGHPLLKDFEDKRPERPRLVRGDR